MVYGYVCYSWRLRTLCLFLPIAFHFEYFFYRFSALASVLLIIYYQLDTNKSDPGESLD